ncbi:MAG: hypothetical protein ACTSUO_04620 [Candidatus Thorarchaeota archaeon]
MIPRFREIDESDDDDIEDLENPIRTHKITMEERGQLFERLNGPEREVTIYTPEVRGLALESYDHLEEILRDDFPGILKHKDIAYLKQQAKLHWATIEKFGERNKVANIEIRVFAESIGAPEATVRAWITKESVPRIYSLFEKALSSSEGKVKVTEIRSRLGGVDCHEEFDDRMSHPYHERHTKIAPSFASDYVSARKFYSFLDELEDGGILRDIARRVGISQPSIHRYVNEKQIPRLIQVAMKEPLEVNTSLDELGITSEARLDDLYRDHPYVMDMDRFPEMDRRARIYIRVKELQAKGELPDLKQRDYAKKLGISHAQLNHYLSDKKIPEMFHILAVNMRARGRHESRLASEGSDHRIDPSLTYEKLKHLKDIENPSVSDLASAVEDIYRASGLTSNVQWVELTPYQKYTGPHCLRDIASSIEKQRVAIEESLNERLGILQEPDKRLRIGVVENKLYFRLQDVSKYNWMHMYQDELFHFHTLEQKQIHLRNTLDRLGLRGGVYLSRLTEQIADHTRHEMNGRPKYDLLPDNSQMRGKSLALALDVTGTKVQDIQSQIQQVGRGDFGIRGPKFPENPIEIDSMFSSILGAGLSDAHIEKGSDGFVYTELHKTRVEVFMEQVQQFGDVYHNHQVLSNGVSRIRFSSTFGRLIEQRGMLKGDKTFQNQGFPDWLKESPPEVLQKYFGPMWAQDGNFYIDNEGRVRFQVDRGVVLRDPGKSEIYGITHRATLEHVDLVCRHGTKKEDVRFGIRRQMTNGRLKELENSSDCDIARIAASLRVVVDSNKSELMNDEMEGLGSLGIKTADYFAYLTYYENTGRLSTLWHCTTRTKDDAMRVGIMCPPEDVLKRKLVEDWMENEPVRRQRIMDGLTKEKGF